MSKFHTLVDSDAFIGRFYPDDAHHERALATFDRLQQERRSIVTTNLVVMEVATVLSHRGGQALAVNFLDMVETIKLPTIFIDERLQHQAFVTFREQKARGTSVTDCANVVVMQFFKIPEILSFDRVYTKDFHLKLAA